MICLHIILPFFKWMIKLKTFCLFAWLTNPLKNSLLIKRSKCFSHRVDLNETEGRKNRK